MNMSTDTDTRDNKESKGETNEDFSSLDKVDIPFQFLGKSFSFLFQCLYESEGVIAISLYRYPKRSTPSVSGRDDNILRYGKATPGMTGSQRSTRSLPYVITAPHPDIVLQLYDEVFVLRARHRNL